MSAVPPDLAVYELLPLPVIVVDGERVLYGNPAFLELSGLTADEVQDRVDTLITRLIANPEQSGMHAIQRELIQGETPPEENWVTHKPTATCPEHRLYRMVRRPGPRPGTVTVSYFEASLESSARQLTQSLVGTSSNLLLCETEREVLELAVESLYRLGFSTSSLIFDGEWIQHGPQQVEPFLREAVEKAAQMPTEQIRFPRTALPPSQSEMLFGERRAVFYPDMHTAVRDAYPAAVRAELRRLFPVMRGLVVPLFIRGTPFGFLSINSMNLPPAVTATMELFAQLVSSGLESARQRREVRGLQQDRVTRERLAALGEAAAVLAHEVRNPLGSILNCVTLLRRGGNAEVLPMLEEEAFRLVRHLIDFTRPLVPQLRKASLGDLVRASIRSLQERGEGAAMRFSVNVTGPDTTQVDETLLQLALENLFRNSIQVSPPGSRVNVTVGERFGSIQLSVEDEGPGIPVADRIRVFEPFFTTRATGSGLGLPLVKRVIEAHGGTISVQDGTLSGARLVLLLPLTAPAERSPGESGLR